MGNLCLSRESKEGDEKSGDLLQQPLRDINGKVGDLGGLECGELSVSHLLTQGDPHTVFTFGESVGEGAFAPVYRATDKRDGEQVAIKLLTLQSEDQARGVALETAAQLKAQNHENIAKVYGLWMDKAWVELCTFTGVRLWIVQELVLSTEGSVLSVKDKLTAHAEAQASASTAEVRVLLEQLSSALAHMHERGVVHRDLKAENIMIAGGDPTEGSGKYKVIDFGSALLLRKGEAEHRDEALIGTFSYLAPECYDFRYSAKVDVFAAACLAAEAWFTGDKGMPAPWGPLELLKTEDGECSVIEQKGMAMVLAEDEEGLRVASEQLVAALRDSILPEATKRLKKRRDKYRLCGAKERQKKLDAELLHPLLARMLAVEPGDRPAMAVVCRCLAEGSVKPLDEPPPAPTPPPPAPTPPVEDAGGGEVSAPVDAGSTPAEGTGKEATPE